MIESQKAWEDPEKLLDAGDYAIFQSQLESKGGNPQLLLELLRKFNAGHKMPTIASKLPRNILQGKAKYKSLPIQIRAEIKVVAKALNNSKKQILQKCINQRMGSELKQLAPKWERAERAAKNLRGDAKKLYGELRQHYDEADLHRHLNNIIDGHTCNEVVDLSWKGTVLIRVPPYSDLINQVFDDQGISKLGMKNLHHKLYRDAKRKGGVTAKNQFYGLAMNLEQGTFHRSELEALWVDIKVAMRRDRFFHFC